MQNPERRVAKAVDATSSPKNRAPPTKVRHYKHLNVKKKEKIRASIINGNSYRNTSKVFGVSLGSVSKIMHSTAEELALKTHSGGRRECIVKITPKIVPDIAAFVFAHPQVTQREMRDETVRTSSKVLSRTTIAALLKNIDISCKRIAQVPPERNTPEAVSMGIEWACAFNELGDAGCQFVFADESGFDVNLSRGRGYARVGETPSVIVPPRGPNVIIITLMGSHIGILYEKYVGDLTARTFGQFLGEKAPIIKKAYPRSPIVIVLDNAKVHKSSKTEGIDIPKTMS